MHINFSHFYAPNFGKLKGHIALGLSVCVSVQNLLRYNFDISYMDSSSKIIDSYYFKSGLSPFLE